MRTVIKELAEKLSRYGQDKVNENTLPRDLHQKLNFLRCNGYVVLDHLVGTAKFSSLSRYVKQSFEKKLNFRTPCLAQSRIDQKRDSDFIRRNFKVSSGELAGRDLLFRRDEVQSYEQVLSEFAPSTLTLDMPSEKKFYDLWLDHNVTRLIQAYMGFTPIMREAFIRRNFPCTYTVMNHKWHRDTNHRQHLLKAFIFFTDCGLETGAHHYVPQSINSPEFRDKIYFDDEEVDAVFSPSEGKQMISKVPAGTIILEDTRGLHKAGIPKRDYRDLGFSIFVPPSFLHVDKPNYIIDRNTYDALELEQKSFIPSRYVA
jgi:hypothetical protein